MSEASQIKGYKKPMENKMEAVCAIVLDRFEKCAFADVKCGVYFCILDLSHPLESVKLSNFLAI